MIKKLKKEDFVLCFQTYLDEIGLKKTAERMAVAKVAFAMKGHFDYDKINQAMVESNFSVSKATLYSVLQHLVEADLLVKHQFTELDAVQYERKDRAIVHHHLICLECGKLGEFKDEMITLFIQNRKIKGFTTDYFGLYMYGYCSKCKCKSNKK